MTARKAYGKRLDIPAGTAVRFEPGETKTVRLVDIAGNRVIRGGNNLADGPVSEAGKKAAMQRVDSREVFPQPPDAMPHKMKRRHYADMFGPTTGDRVRLGDTSLFLEVERDYTVYGDECKFGGGKTIREGQGQAAGVGQAEALGLRHHQRAGRGLYRHLQGRHRHQKRPDRRHRQGRKSRCDGRRHQAE